MPYLIFGLLAYFSIGIVLYILVILTTMSEPSEFTIVDILVNAWKMLIWPYVLYISYKETHSRRRKSYIDEADDTSWPIGM